MEISEKRNDCRLLDYGNEVIQYKIGKRFILFYRKIKNSWQRNQILIEDFKNHIGLGEIKNLLILPAYIKTYLGISDGTSKPYTKPYRCYSCNKKKDDVSYRYDPFAFQIYDSRKKLFYCNDCFENLELEI